MIKLSKHLHKYGGFSLVEMLMALLVASLLLAALAPVMTKRMGNENINVSGVGRNTSENFAVFDDVSKNGTDDNSFTIPNNAINVRISMIGGGGAGGSATFGSKIITASENNWKVPDGVKKIRVYMVGGGGGGASGGIVLANQLGNLKEGYYEYKDSDPANTEPKNTGGEFKNQKISDLITTKTESRFHPTIDSKCKSSGYEKWESNITSLNVSVTGCGAGGAGGGRDGGGGGSGGYKTQAGIALSDNYIIRISGTATAGGCKNARPAGFSSGAGGGGGGADYINNQYICTGITRVAAAGGTYGGNGGIGCETYCGNCAATVGNNGSGTLGAYGGGHASAGADGGRGGYYGGGGGGGSYTHDCGGGGGGGPAILMNNSNSVLFMASGGAGGGGGGAGSGHGAGGGGGSEAGGGGGGGGYWSCSPGGGAGVGGGASGQACGSCTGSTCHAAKSHGGGGGGAKNGISGTSYIVTDDVDSNGAGGKLSTNIFGNNYCNGGDTGADGKPGAMRISWNATSNALKCKYNTLSNGGSGGGGGEVWIGEIDVTPGSYLNFHIGSGGSVQRNYSSNGNNGGNTYITNNAGAVLKSVAGGEGGKYSTSDNLSSFYGLGKGLNSAGFNDWTGKYPTTVGSTGGLNGSSGKTIAQGSSGGKGGGIYFMDAVLMDGGNAGNRESNGGDSINYGAGGGGGGGVATAGHFPGYGGKGGNGYIYIEWGNSNGGGGSSGEIVEEKKIISATAGTKIEITIGEGGKGSEIEHDASTKYKPGNKGGNGKDTVVKIKGKSYSAKGGVGGDGGGLNKGEHGMGGALKNLLAPSVSFKGEDGIDNYGGIGATAIYKYAANGEGMGGCGGNMISGKCFSPSDTPYGKDGAKSGSGGGGGSVRDSVPYKGGNGGDGLVLIEWEEFRE